MLVTFPLWTVIEIAWMMCLVVFVLPDFSCIFLPISLLSHKILNCQIHFQNQWFWPNSLIVKDRSLDSEQWFHWNFRVGSPLCQKTKTNVDLIKCFWAIVLNQAPKSQYLNSRDLTFRQVNEIVILLMKAKKSVIVIDISCQEGGNWALC